MLRRTLLVLAVLSTALVPVSGHAAAQVRSIDVVNNAFVARAVAAVAGDTIRWDVKGSGHTVTAYSGGAFDSGVLALNSNDRFEALFDGGTILYRCKNHSVLSGPGNDCAGMCGKLTDAPPSDLPGAPTVSSPAHNFATDSKDVTFTGGVTGNAVLVRMYEGALELGHGVEPVQGSWQFTRQFENGTRNISFVAEHPEGYRSLAGPARTVPNPEYPDTPGAPPTIIERFITVTIAASDSAPPVILLDQPRDEVSRSPLIITGRVLDDVAVGTITVRVRDNLLMANKPLRPATCVGCGTNSASFYSSYSLDPGYYTITVTATDLTNKVSVALRDVVVLV